MCGICGFVGPRDSENLRRMNAALLHRGPDDQGIWESETASLAMRRLSIVDVETGQQPVFNEDRTIALVFNGEIYNHQELRRILENHGHKFTSDHSDSEVIVHLYEQFGESSLDHLNGMFAIALWDARKKRLFLARDRLGIKPLFYTWINGVFCFSSEIKSLLQHSKFVKKPNFPGLHHYFSFKHVPAPDTAFAGVHQLSAGHFGVLAEKNFKTFSWWRPNYVENTHITEQDAATVVRELLEDSVKLHMQSDVDVGAYLSGGVDSSAVVALMSRLSSRPVNTFTLVYDDAPSGKADDRAFAQKIAKRYGTQHFEQILDHRHLPGKLNQIVDAFDEPFSGVISTYFLTELIGKHVKVALSGDGADEMFGSYLPHRLAQPLAALERIKRDSQTAKLMPTTMLLQIEDKKDLLEQLLARGDEAARRMAQMLADEKNKAALYSPYMRELTAPANSELLLRNIYATANTTDPLNRALYIDNVNLLQNQILPFVDRLSMAHSVEVRPPFLDHRLFEFVATLPGSLKIRGDRVKHILKEAVTDLLPLELIDRPKEGFLMPINDWISGHLSGWISEILKRATLSGLFNPIILTQMQTQGSARENSASLNQQWNIVMFQLWWEKHFA